MVNEEVTMTMSVLPGAMTGISTLMSGLVSINNVFMDLTRQIDASFGLVDSTIITASTIVAQFGFQAAQAFGEFEQGMKIAQMVSGQTAQDMDLLKTKANEFAVSYRTDIDQITEGLQTLGRAGLNSASEQTEVLKEGLSTAKLESRDLNGVLEELIQNTALLGGNLNDSNFGENSKYVNDLLVATSMTAPITTHDVSETLKYSGGIAAAAGANIESDAGKEILEDYMGAIAAFAQKGVTGSIAGTALRAFFNKPATQDESVKDALATIHLKPEYLWEEGEETMKPVSEQIALIENQMKELDISTMDQLQIWSKIVGGKMGQQMMKLHSSDIKNLTRDIRQADDAGDLAAGTFQTFQSNMKEMTEQGQVAFRSFGENVARFLNPVLDIITKILEMLSNPVNSALLFGGFISFLILAASKVKQVFNQFKTEFSQFMKYFQDGEKLLSIRPSTIRKAERNSQYTGSRYGDSKEYQERYNTPDTGKAFIKDTALARQEYLEELYSDPSVLAMRKLASENKFGKSNHFKKFLDLEYGQSSPEYYTYAKGNIIDPDLQKELLMPKIDTNYIIKTIIDSGKWNPKWGDNFFDVSSPDYLNPQAIFNQHGFEIADTFNEIIEQRATRDIGSSSASKIKLEALNKKRLEHQKALLNKEFGVKFWDVDSNILEQDVQGQWNDFIREQEIKYQDDEVALRRFREMVEKADIDFQHGLTRATNAFLEFRKGIDKELTDKLTTKKPYHRVTDWDNYLARDSTPAEVYAVLNDWYFSYGSGRIKDKAVLDHEQTKKETLSQRDARKKTLENQKKNDDKYSLTEDKKGDYYSDIEETHIATQEEIDEIARQAGLSEEDARRILISAGVPVAPPKGLISPTSQEVDSNGKPVPKTIPENMEESVKEGLEKARNAEPTYPGRTELPGFSELLAGVGTVPYDKIQEIQNMDPDVLANKMAEEFFKDRFKISGTRGVAIRGLPIEQIAKAAMDGKNFGISQKDFEKFTVGAGSQTIGQKFRPEVISELYTIFEENYEKAIMEFRKNLDNFTATLDTIPTKILEEEEFLKEFSQAFTYNDRGIISAMGGTAKGTKEDLINQVAKMHLEGSFNFNMDKIKSFSDARLKLLMMALGLDVEDYKDGKKLNKNKFYEDLENYKSPVNVETSPGAVMNTSVPKINYDFGRDYHSSIRENFRNNRPYILQAEEISKKAKGELGLKEILGSKESLDEIAGEIVKINEALVQLDTLFNGSEESNALAKELADKRKKLESFYLLSNKFATGAVTEYDKKMLELERTINKREKDRSEKASYEKQLEKAKNSGLKIVPTKEDLLEMAMERDGAKNSVEYMENRKSDYLDNIRANQKRFRDREWEKVSLKDQFLSPFRSARNAISGFPNSLRGAYWNWGAMKNLPENATGWQQLKGVGSNLINLAGGPLMMAIEAVTAAIEIWKGWYEKYTQDLKQSLDNLKEAYSKRDSAENSLKQTYRNQNPDATEEEINDKVLEMYGTMYDDLTKHHDKYQKLASTAAKLPDELEYDKEADDGTYKVKEEEEKTEEEEYKEALKENTQALYQANASLLTAMNQVRTKQTDSWWGLDGWVSKASDAVFKDPVQSFLMTSPLGASLYNNLKEEFNWGNNEKFSSSGKFLLTASQADENYSGYTEMAGLMLEDFKDAQGADTNEQLKNGLTQMMGSDSQYTMEFLRGEGKNYLKGMTDFSKKIGTDRNAALQTSMKYDTKTWQKLSKEIAKYESKNKKTYQKGDDKASKRIENIIKKIQSSMGIGFDRTQILQAQYLQMAQDMYGVAQQVFVPLIAENAASAASTAAGMMETVTNTDYTGGNTYNTAAIAQTIAAMLGTIAIAQSADAARNQAIMGGDLDGDGSPDDEDDKKIQQLALDTNSGDEFLRQSLVQSKYGPTLFGAPIFQEDFAKTAGLQNRSAGLYNARTYLETTLMSVYGLDAETAHKAAQKAVNEADAKGAKIEDMYKTFGKNWTSDDFVKQVEQAYLNSGVGEDEGNGGGGSGSGSGSGNNDDNGTRKERVDLVLCNKKTIPKLNVNLFKKPPSFTILNKNFKLRDVKINSEDKPKAIMAAIKNGFIDVQKRTDPKIIQDEEAVYDPAAATDGTNVPSGSAKTRTT